LRGFLGGFFAGYGMVVGMLTAALLFLVGPVGALYWLWTAIQIGSFSMFLIGCIPPLMLFTGPLGAWFLIFGVPGWVLSLFGG